MDDFQKCKYGFLQQAFVPWVKNEITLSAGLKELEVNAEVFATMSMRILDRPAPPEPIDTFKDADTPPLDAYDEVFDVTNPHEDMP